MNRILRNLRDYFALRPHLQDPWKFIWSLKTAPTANDHEVKFKAGFTLRCAVPSVDRRIVNGIFGRDEYQLNQFAPGSLDTVIDVGANIGIFSIRVAPLARRVIAYEPMPENFRVLQENLGKAGCRHVLPVQQAISGKKGPLDLWIAQSPGSHSILRTSPDATACIKIEAVTFREVFAEHSIERCDLLKLDCEGAEYDSLSAMPDELWPRISRIHMEFHEGPPGWDGPKLAEFLQEKGYRCQLQFRSRHPKKGHLFAVRTPSTQS